MSTMLSLLSITLLTIAAEQIYAQDTTKEHQGLQPCGGHLKGPVGTITTPNFPNPFPVPIKCKWIIEHDIVNGTISVYFTQQYTTTGLTFTEYLYYDESYKLGERRALTLTDENITKIKWLQKTCLKNANVILLINLRINKAAVPELI
ncbi:CUB domain-containing protein 2-like [Spodoptera litura]|uniref:CUB domain-containing protein 2-like n=1 Tax=Spodoptera litura TaxID=69820 RepID=A0A9J7DXA4_SPOLT|nr:CUB domain-containing protein 2-like [Spodoptera litura]